MRGGIIDVYPADALSAVRIEFFDDELDSIRAVDVMSQRSQGQYAGGRHPARERSARAASGQQRWRGCCWRRWRDRKPSLKRARAEKATTRLWRICRWRRGEIAAPEAFTRENRTMERFGEKLRAAVSQMQNGVSNRMLEKFINLLYPQTETILDYMNRPIVVLDEPEALFARMDSRTGEFGQAITAALERGEALPEQHGLMLTQDEALAAMRQTTLLALTTILRPVEKAEADAALSDGRHGRGQLRRTDARHVRRFHALAAGRLADSGALRRRGARRTHAPILEDEGREGGV